MNDKFMKNIVLETILKYIEESRARIALFI